MYRKIRVISDFKVTADFRDTLFFPLACLLVEAKYTCHVRMRELQPFLQNAWDPKTRVLQTYSFMKKRTLLSTASKTIL